MFKNLSKQLPNLLPVGILLEFLILVLSYFEANGDVTLFFQAMARLSGRVSLLFFSILFVYATLFPSVEADSEPLRIKFILARNFAILHIIHWFLLVTAVQLSGFELAPTRVAGGALAYVMIVLLPFVIKGKLFRKIPLRWVFTVYLTYVWLIFFITYLTRIMGKATHITGNMVTYQVLIGITFMLMLWRVSRLVKTHF